MLNPYPYIDLVNLGYSEKELMVASGVATMNFEIHAGIRSFVLDYAYQGTDEDRKGIAGMCSDIAAALKNNRFDNAFIRPVTNITVTPRFLFDKSETTLIGLVTLSGDVRFVY